MWRAPLLWVGLVIALLALAFGPWVLNRGRFQVTPDSWSYLNAAWHVTQGRGLVLSQVDARRTTSPDAVVLRSLTQWPPVYPLLATIPIAAGLPLDVAGVITNYIMTILALGLALWLILRHAPPYYAAVSGLLLGSAPVMVPIATMAWSEGTALCCLMAAHLLLDEALRRKEQDAEAWPPVDWLALAVVLGFLSRYAFVLVLPGILLGLWWALPAAAAARRAAILRFTSVVALGVIPWLVRNWWLAGTLEGKEPRPGMRALRDHAEEILWQLFGRELPGKGWLAALLLLFMLGLIFNAAWPRLIASGRSRRVLLLPIAALLASGALAFAETHRHFDPVSFRFLAPVTLLLLVTGLILAAEFLERGDLPLAYRQWGWLLPVPLLALSFRAIPAQHQLVGVWVLLCASEALCRVGPVFRERAIGWLVLVAMLGFHVKSAQVPLVIPQQARHGHIAAWMRQHVPPGTVYAGTRAARDLLLEAPEYVQLIGVSSTVNRPELWLDADSLQQLQRRYGLELLIFPGPPSPSSAAAYGPYLAQLMTKGDLPPHMGEAIAFGNYRVVWLPPPPERNED